MAQLMILLEQMSTENRLHLDPPRLFAGISSMARKQTIAGWHRAAHPQLSPFHFAMVVLLASLTSTPPPRASSLCLHHEAQANAYGSAVFQGTPGKALSKTPWPRQENGKEEWWHPPIPTLPS